MNVVPAVLPWGQLSEQDCPVPVVNAVTGAVLTGDSAPRRRDLHHWLKVNPEYEVEGDVLEVGLLRDAGRGATPGRVGALTPSPRLQLLASSRAQRKRRRKKKSEKVKEMTVLTGVERVKIIDMKTGKKVSVSWEGGSLCACHRKVAGSSPALAD